MTKYDPVTYWSKRKDLKYKGKDPRYKNTPEWAEQYIKAHTIPDKILDYGVGTGGKLHLFDGMKITGLDIVDTYKDKAIQRWQNLGNRGFQHIIGDISNLDDSFDTALCSKVLLHVPDNDIRRVSEHLNRIAKRVIVWDIDSEGNADHVFNHDFSDLFDMKNIIKKDGQVLFHT